MVCLPMRLFMSSTAGMEFWGGVGFFLPKMSSNMAFGLTKPPCLLGLPLTFFLLSCRLPLMLEDFLVVVSVVLMFFSLFWGVVLLAGTLSLCVVGALVSRN